MNSKKKSIVKRSISLAVIAVVTVIGLISYFYISLGACVTIKLNWGISLFSCEKVLYYQDSGPSFLGDGDRLTVLRFKDFNKASEIVHWKEGSNPQIENETASVISRLKITDMYKPDLNTPYKYYTITKGDNSTIYLIYNMNNNYLYVIENIM